MGRDAELSAACCLARHGGHFGRKYWAFLSTRTVTVAALCTKATECRTLERPNALCAVLAEVRCAWGRDGIPLNRSHSRVLHDPTIDGMASKALGRGRITGDTW